MAPFFETNYTYFVISNDTSLRVVLFYLFIFSLSDEIGRTWTVRTHIADFKLFDEILTLTNACMS